MKPGRRGFISGALGLAMTAGWVRPARAIEQASDGTGMRLAQTYVIPAVRDFHHAAGVIREDMDRMCRASLSWQTERLQKNFRALIAAWSRIAFLRFGPLVEDNRYERIFFWPDPRSVMLRQIRPLMQGAQAVDDLKTQSVALQGLPALEYVLYADKGLLATGREGEHQAACRYATAIAANIADIAQALRRAWQPQGDFTRDFTQPGEGNAYYRNENEVLTETLKALSTGLRFEADVKLRTALGARQDKARPKILPFWRSGLALFAQAEAALGLADFHAAAAFAQEPDWLARNLDQELRQSADILYAGEGRALRMGEDAGLYRELTLAGLKLNNARGMVEGNLAPALGVGLGFNALDGD